VGAVNKPEDKPTMEQRMAAVIRYLKGRSSELHVDELDGMIIGSVDGVHITEDTPLDPDQWEGGQPWVWKKT
jgi:hypothetical protein